ncbi:MAG TPA: type II toxin-antitoxin system VapC family toxin [Thermoanaerobaculia bacterium]
MRLLLDTHIFLWYIIGDPRIKPALRHAIEDCDVAYLSVVSIWEATTKYQLGKLPPPEPPHPWLTAQRENHGIDSLPLGEAAVARLATLPMHHRDPFDRMLVCQALEDDLLLVTVDSMLHQYPAKLLGLADS